MKPTERMPAFLVKRPDATHWETMGVNFNDVVLLRLRSKFPSPLWKALSPSVGCGRTSQAMAHLI